MDFGDIMQFSAYIFVFAFVVWNYLIRMEDLYLQQRNPLYIATAVGWRIWRGSESKLTHPTFVKERKATARARSAWRVLERSGIRRQLCKFVHCVHLYNDSFLSSLPGIIFSYTFGIRNMLSMRKYSRLWIPASAMQLSFGQIVAVSMLILPILAAAEVYYGKYVSLARKVLT